MALTEDEALAGGLMKALDTVVGKDVVDKVIAQLPAKTANGAQRARDIGKQMKNRK